MGEIPSPTTEFLWGVATSAYQAEGGYNGEGQPQTNWAVAERAGVVSRVGGAADFWTRYEEDFAHARRLGLNAFRLSIEWSRIQPCQRCVEGKAPPFDTQALDHYATIIRACRTHHLEPVVTLHHFVHPAWMGADPWLHNRTPDLYAEYVKTAVTHINTALVESGTDPIRLYITINEPNMLVLNTYFGRQFPSAARRGFQNVMRAYDILLAAHVRAYNIMHDVHEQHGWGTPRVTFNNYCSDLYWSDKLLLDLIDARHRGVQQREIDSYVCQQAADFRRAFRAARLPLHRDLPYFAGKLAKWLSDSLGGHWFKASNFPQLIEALYTAKRARALDYVALDYYDPFLAHSFRFPRWSDIEMRARSLRAWMMNSVTSKWWDWRILPRGLYFFVKTYSADFKLPALIAENGMALPVRWDNTRIKRRDGMTRSKFLRLHLREVQHLRRDGVPLFGYLHWSLFDNYEWGSFTPRFGLLSIDYERGTERLTRDPWGDVPSETYAALIAAAELPSRCQSLTQTPARS